MNYPNDEKPFSAFVPVFLIAFAISILFGWNLWMAITLHNSGTEIKAEQDKQFAKAGELEEKLKAITGDLITLAKSDADAAKIAQRYIKSQ